MNRERAKELLPIIQAFAEGKDIQAKPPGFGWKTPTDPAFFNGDEYRIKPEPREFFLMKGSNIFYTREQLGPDPEDDKSVFIHVREVMNND